MKRWIEGDKHFCTMRNQGLLFEELDAKHFVDGFQVAKDIVGIHIDTSHNGWVTVQTWGPFEGDPITVVRRRPKSPTKAQQFWDEATQRTKETS